MVMTRILKAGEQGMVVEFGSSIDPAINRQVHHVVKQLRDKAISGVKEIVPTYRSLLVYFNPLVVSRAALGAVIQQIIDENGIGDLESREQRVIRIPVCYGGDYGPDIAFVAGYTGLSVQEVIAIHTSEPYQVYMLGFTPGFPYLGGMSNKIATPRLEKPRTSIPAGSVGIAGNQTGFYPIASPGGWQLIGRTPVKAFDARKNQPFLFDAGDYLQFYPVSVKEYQRIAAQVEQGSYESEITWVTAGGGGQ